MPNDNKMRAKEIKRFQLKQKSPPIRESSLLLINARDRTHTQRMVFNAQVVVVLQTCLTLLSTFIFSFLAPFFRIIY